MDRSVATYMMARSLTIGTYSDGAIFVQDTMSCTGSKSICTDCRVPYSHHGHNLSCASNSDHDFYFEPSANTAVHHYCDHQCFNCCISFPKLCIVHCSRIWLSIMVYVAVLQLADYHYSLRLRLLQSVKSCQDFNFEHWLLFALMCMATIV